MEKLYFLKSEKKQIEGKDFYCITILDFVNCQIFKFYKLVDTKTTQFINSHKAFDNISNDLTFAIKRKNKISFDLK